MALFGNIAIGASISTAKFSKGVSTLGASLTALAGPAAAAAAAIAGVAGVGAAVGVGVKLAGELEQAEIAFTTMLGSGEKAKSFLADLSKFAAATPFELGELRQASQQLLAFGFTADQSMGLIESLSDVAAGTQKPIGEFVGILGKIRASGGTANLGDLNMLADRSVPIFDLLTKQMGKTAGQIKHMASTGKISYADLQKAISTVTSEGGLFYQASLAQSQSLFGLWSTFKDNLNTIFLQIGQIFIEGFDIKGLIASATSGIETILNTILSWKPVLVEALTVVTSAVLAGWQSIKAIFSWVASFLPSMGGGFSTWKDTIVNALLTAEYAFTNWQSALDIAVAWTKLKAVQIWEEIKYTWENIGTITKNLGNALVGLWQDSNYNVGVAINNGLIELLDRFKFGYEDIGNAAVKAGKWLVELEQKKWKMLWEIAKWGWEKLKNPFGGGEGIDSANFGLGGAIFNAASGGGKKEYRDIGANLMSNLTAGLPPRPLSELEQKLLADLTRMQNSFGGGLGDFINDRRDAMGLNQPWWQDALDIAGLSPAVEQAKGLFDKAVGYWDVLQKKLNLGPSDSLINKAKELSDSLISPLQKHEQDMKELDQMLKWELITQDEYNKAKKNALPDNIRSLNEEAIKPIDKFSERVAELQAWRESGKLSEGGFQAGLAKIQQDLGLQTPEVKLAGLSMMGSREARSDILKHKMGQARDPLEQIKKSSSSTAAASDAMVGYLRDIANKISIEVVPVG